MPFWGVPIIRTIMVWCLYLGSSYLGKLPFLRGGGVGGVLKVLGLGLLRQYYAHFGLNEAISAALNLSILDHVRRKSLPQSVFPQQGSPY